MDREIKTYFLLIFSIRSPIQKKKCGTTIVQKYILKKRNPIAMKMDLKSESRPYKMALGKIARMKTGNFMPLSIPYFVKQPSA